MTTDLPTSVAGAENGAAEVLYQSLYRRFRPQRFSEVRGQEHVTTALRNAMREGRITHAYLFSGPRGTGKTSTARILAKALNCEAPEDGEPCGRCEPCRSIALGTSFDVHELDAASSNGVDAMRDLVARAALSSPGRWKVYIVDEVHMLSTAASNALLKTLEEPPEHVVFVLATTDPQKVLPTVRSRTQHYEFHLLDQDVLAGLLAEVASTAELDLPEGALDSALRRGRGSARDALSALDQVAAAGMVDDDLDALRAVVAAIGARDLAQALGALDAAIRQGREPQQFAVELIERLRGGFLALVAPQVAHGGAGADLAAEARELGTARCVRAMEVLGAAVVAMREAPEPRVTLEMAVVRLASPEADDSPAALVERLERLERRLADLAASGWQGPAGSGGSPLPPPPQPPPPPPTSSASRPRPAGPADTAGPAGPGSPAEGSTPATPGGRPALGAYRRRQAAPPAGGAEESSAATASTAASGATASTAASGATVATAPGAAEAATSTPEPVPGGEPPTRDELVSAWGDHVLGRLRPKVRAVYQAGRFVDGDRAAAVFALPNAAHLNHAEPLRGEVAAALAKHFGRPVPIQLVVDSAGPLPGDAPAPSPPPPSPSAASSPPASAPPASAPPAAVLPRTGEDARRSNGAPPTSAGLPATPVAEASAPSEELEDLAELFDEASPVEPAVPGLSWAEESLRRAFPGAEEVAP